MPRRNRNVHAFRIDADELADQADELAADLTSAFYGSPVNPINTQVVNSLDLF
jgi:hypothetical protein